MDANANVKRPRLIRISKANVSTTWNAGAKRRRRLLAEFLQEKSARQLANAQEETTSQDLEILVQNQVTLSYDLLFKIFILLPAESLFRLQFVCKKWFGLINSSIFIRCHAQQSETVLICKKLTLSEPGNYAALRDKPKSYFHFLDLDRGNDNFMESSVVELVDIRASYDGLVLVTLEKNKSLILMNPVTRKHIALPLGTEGSFCVESFGIAFCNEAKTYKVVHLFGEKSGCTGCEVLSICTRKWTRMEDPPYKLVRDIRQIPISVGGSLYWMPTKRGCDYFVSMNLQDEKFVSKNLPVSNAVKDRLLEIGGNLGFVTHAQLDLLHVWILITDGGTSENWINQYSINLNVYVAFPYPICSSNNGKGMVLEMKNELYVFNFDR
ncbi:hypothetical protein Pfo_021041 [Paulownia fortunei]|nr:hypothetical protein Pfo_021041 [Paulownia fortunei]